jgi:hypothetical protein
VHSTNQENLELLNLGVSSDYLRQARFVLKHGSDLADSVLNGSISLDNAYEEARIRKGQRAMAVARICFETKQSVRDGAWENSKKLGVETRTGHDSRKSFCHQNFSWG